VTGELVRQNREHLPGACAYKTTQAVRNVRIVRNSPVSMSRVRRAVVLAMAARWHSMAEKGRIAVGS
jgi:hypothetical protein